VKHNRILTVSMLCILVASPILIGLWALSRVSQAYQYAAQFAGINAKPAQGATGANLSLTLYGDPASARQIFDAFQYFRAENLEWRGAFPVPQGPPLNLGLTFASALFEKRNPDLYVLNVTTLHIVEKMGDLANVDFQADDADAEVKFWTLNNGLPALNVTAVLKGNVKVVLSIAVLPLPGLSLAAYSYEGDRFVISICVVKPVEVAIVNPPENGQVSGNVKIEALVKTAPGISLDGGNVWWWIEHEKWGSGRQPMTYNQGTGLWEAVWQTYNEPAVAGNGWCRLAVRAEGIEVNKPQGFRQGDEKRINVEVVNPPISVGAYVQTGEGRQELSGVNINWWYDKEGGTWQTRFDLQPRIDYTLEAPGGLPWGQGQNVGFQCWRIEDQDGTIRFEFWGGTKLTIDRNVFRMLFDDQGNPRQLNCVYNPM